MLPSRAGRFPQMRSSTPKRKPLTGLGTPPGNQRARSPCPRTAVSEKAAMIGLVVQPNAPFPGSQPPILVESAMAAITAPVWLYQ